MLVSEIMFSIVWVTCICKKINQYVIIVEYSLFENVFQIYVALAAIVDQNTMITWFWFTMHTTDFASWYHDLNLCNLHGLDMRVI